VKTWTGLSTLIALYALFSYILLAIFHNMISILIAGILAALVGLAISLLIRGKEA
jgi:hypothetical protein